LTEHGGVSSHFQLEKEANKSGIKPIFGLEAYCGSTREQAGWGGPEDNPIWLPARSQWKHHLTVLATNAEGYRNLNRIVTRSYLDHHYHPTVSGDILATFRHGIACLSGCSGSNLACALLGGKGTEEHNEEPDFRAARETIERFVACFGDFYFLEVQPFWELPRTIAMNTSYEKLSKETGVPIVVTNDVHYPRMEDSEMQAVLHTVHRGKHSVDDTMREWNYQVPMTLPESDRALYDRLRKTGLSASAAWGAIEMSAVVADMCNVTLPKAARLRYPISDEDLKPWT
jgi:DNA polymerase-3 subunit alpha